MAEIDNIELRSEKTRQIIGMIPSGIIRYGTLIISAIIITLLIAAYFIPYPDNLQVKAMVVNLDNCIQIRAYVPYSHLSTIQTGMNASIEFDGYPSSDYGYTSTIITDIDKEVHNINGHNFFTIYMDIQSNDDIDLYKDMSGTANILISNKSILHKILKI